MTTLAESSAALSTAAVSAAALSSVTATTPPLPEKVPVSIKSLMDAGAHFGHQTQRWNPKMAPFIFTQKNGIHIINLDATMKAWLRARKHIVDTVSRGGTILLCATKPQARDLVKSEAARCGAFFVTTRWLGGALTNFDTIKNSLARMNKMEDTLKKAEIADSGVKIKKKEKVKIGKDLAKLDSSLGGIRSMKRPPDLLFVIDINKEAIAIAEANRLHIPVIALVDTNVDPTKVQFPIPSNDDATRTIYLFLSNIADAVLEGKAAFDSRRTRETEVVKANEQRKNA